MRHVRQNSHVDVIELHKARPLQVFGCENGEASSGAVAEGEVGESGAAAVKRGVLIAVENRNRYYTLIGLVVEKAANNFVMLNIEQAKATALLREGGTQTIVT